MPTIAPIGKIRIMIYLADHGRPHVYAVGPGAEAKIEIGSLAVVRQSGFSTKEMKLVLNSLRTIESDYWRRGKMGKSKKQVSRESLVTENDIRVENAKIRISMFIPISLQDAYKAEAAKLGIGYQTLMQIKLREALDNPIEDRLARVEKKLFSKHG